MQTSSRRKRDGHKEKVGREGRVAGESIERSPLRSRKGSYAESVVNVLEEVLLDGRRREEGQHSFLSSRLSRLRDSITVTVRERGKGEREREREKGEELVVTAFMLPPRRRLDHVEITPLCVYLLFALPLFPTFTTHF